MTATEQKKEAENPPQDIAAGAAALPAVEKATEKAPPDLSKKTTGEKYYGVIKFITADVFIMAATAVLAYVARYGKETYAGIPNYLKKFQDSFHAKLLDNKILPLGGDNKAWGERLAGATASTTILMHGGNAFIIPMKWFEDSKKKIVGYLNQKFGKEGEKEIGDKRLQHAPKQSWGDIIKGRFSAWGLIFTAFVSFDFIFGKGRHDGMYKLDKYEEKFGRWLAGFTKEGKELSKIPITKELPKELAHNTTYRFGKILALDIFATMVSVLVWNFISAGSAKKRRKEQIEALRDLQETALIPPVIASSSPAETLDNSDSKDKSHTKTVQPRPSPAEKSRTASHAETYVNQLSDTAAAQLGA